jgi:hypothetical protein
VNYNAIQALNWSTLKHLATSPLLCRHRVDNPQPDKEAFALGRAIHVATLEPERWTREYVVEPDFGEQLTKNGEPAKNPKATAGYKSARADWVASVAPGAIVLDAADHALAERCASAIREHRVAGPLLYGARAEEVITWTDPETGTECKGRLDGITPRHLLDIKSTRRDSVRRFAWDVSEYLYHAQIAWYHDGAIAAGVLSPGADGPYLIAVQTSEPHDVMAFRLPLITLITGRAVYRNLLTKYLQCQAANWWPGVAPELVDLELPQSAAPQQQEEEETW